MSRLRSLLLLLFIVALVAACSPQPSAFGVERSTGGALPDTSATPAPANTRAASKSVPSAAGFFRDADCYGERLARCLGVNRELDARSADPFTCQRDQPRICLVPAGNVRPDVVEAIVRFHRETKGLEVFVLPSVELPASLVFAKTSQVSAEGVRDAVDAQYRVTNSTPSTYIVITPIDVRPLSGEFAWMFGARYGVKGNHNRGVFSYFRMLNVPPYDGSPLTDELLHTRVAKYAARYTALLHFAYPMGDDIAYLNYRDMYGFSDLDSMGDLWPIEAPPGP